MTAGVEQLCQLLRTAPMCARHAPPLMCARHAPPLMCASTCAPTMAVLGTHEHNGGAAKGLGVGIGRSGRRDVGTKGRRDAGT